MSLCVRIQPNKHDSFADCFCILHLPVFYRLFQRGCPLPSRNTVISRTHSTLYTKGRHIIGRVRLRDIPPSLSSGALKQHIAEAEGFLYNDVLAIFLPGSDVAVATTAILDLSVDAPGTNEQAPISIIIRDNSPRSPALEKSSSPFSIDQISTRSLGTSLSTLDPSISPRWTSSQNTHQAGSIVDPLRPSRTPNLPLDPRAQDPPPGWVKARTKNGLFGSIDAFCKEGGTYHRIHIPSRTIIFIDVVGDYEFLKDCNSGRSWTCWRALYFESGKYHICYVKTTHCFRNKRGQ
ncbi:hypothetical protein DL93DRAFT_1707553 [Clavulina sp. PMI_390]|nr:hypothetical protein DL93DRAFT_1707553 [Clavulina sp. PMI_390]